MPRASGRGRVPLALTSGAAWASPAESKAIGSGLRAAVESVRARVTRICYVSTWTISWLGGELPLISTVLQTSPKLTAESLEDPSSESMVRPVLVWGFSGNNGSVRPIFTSSQTPLICHVSHGARSRDAFQTQSGAMKRSALAYVSAFVMHVLAVLQDTS